MAKKLYINFLWHMHQPYYRKTQNGNSSMPWVRLHGIKSYYDMPKLVGKVPEVKVNFNLVPALLKQIEEYLEGQTDDYLKISKIPAEELSKRQRNFIIENFFQAHLEKMIAPYPRYRELYYKNKEDYTTCDFRDLQVWFNLTWFAQDIKDNNPIIKEMIAKGKGFTEEDKREILDLQITILGELRELYKKLRDNKKIEISTTPFYHPILPLIINSDEARKCQPESKLPVPAFKYREDACWHVEEAVRYHHSIFGEAPRGVWPAEGAVSDAALELFIENDFKWAASDEDVLRRSIDNWNEDALYQPYCYKSDAGEIALVFRNHGLSDLIGFTYQNWKTENAVENFLYHLHNIRNSIQNNVGLVSIIMDGENAWEYYHRNGWDFLLMLYEKISADNNLELTTISSYLEEFPAQNKISSIHPGSWIYADYSTWVGDPVKNKAWKELLKVREALEEKKEKIPQNIYIAEGSDWFWWYGEPHSSKNDYLFDDLFRSNLRESCEKSGIMVSEELNIPLFGRKERAAEILKVISPEINGKEDDYHEWLGGVCYQTSNCYGTMHCVSKIIKTFTYGFDKENIYLRWDYPDISKLEGLKLRLVFQKDREIKVVEIALDEFRQSQEDIKWQLGEILEVMIPLKFLKYQSGTPLNLRWTLEEKSHPDNIIEYWPQNNYLPLKKPGELI